MNKNFFEQFKNIRLTNEEQSRIRARVESRINLSPSSLRAKPARIHSPYSFVFPMRFAAMMLLIAIVGGGSLTYAAELALPGDALYSMKINFNENIRSAVVFGNVAEAYWNETRVERRLEEINTLRSENKLTKERASIAEKAFVAQSSKLAASIKTLKKQGQHKEAADVTQKILPELQSYEVAIADSETPKMAATMITVPASTTPLSGDIVINPTTVATSTSDVAITVATDTPAIDNDTSGDVLVDTKSDSATSPAEIEAHLAASISAQAKILSAENDAPATTDQTKTTTTIVVPATTTPVIVPGDKTPVTATTTPATTITPTPATGTMPVVIKNAGTITGTVSIGPICPVETIGSPCLPTPEMYAARHVIVTNKVKKVVADTTLDKDGNFKISLPSGMYRVEVKNDSAVGTTTPAQNVTVKTGQTLKLQFSVDTGIR